jgi:hypothetical protein
MEHATADRANVFAEMAGVEQRMADRASALRRAARAERNPYRKRALEVEADTLADQVKENARVLEGMAARMRKPGLFKLACQARAAYAGVEVR